MKTDINNRKHAISATLAALAVVLGIIAAPLIGRASGVQQAQGPRSLAIPAGGSVTLNVRAFCLDFGKDFPTADINGTTVASDKIRAALNYAINKGYTEGNPQQVELAVWFLSDGTWHATEHAIGQEIVDNATTVPNDSADGTALADAIAQKQVSVSAKFVPQTKGNYYGDGEVVIKNLTGAEIKVYMRIGLVFQAPAGNFQRLAGYDLGTQKVEVQGTPAIAATIAPTTAPTSAPATQAPATVVPATVAPTVEQPTATTEAATSTPEAATSTPVPSGTGGSLPTTGVPDSTPYILVSIGIISSLAILVAGFALRRKQL